MMLKQVACLAVICTAISPALARDRNVDVFDAEVRSQLIAAAASTESASLGQQRFLLPDGRARLEMVHPVQLWRLDRVKITRQPVRFESLTQKLTSDAGGTYAVRDTMRDMRRPHIRKTALSTALVLKIDGKDETDSVGVGGGGVAQAVWRAIPH